jgi:hypothetical protein
MWLDDAEAQPEWLREAFALAHPSALDPGAWAKAKQVERHRIEQARLCLGRYPGRDRLTLAVAERLTCLPDVLIYDEYSPVELFPCIIIKFRNERPFGTFVPRRLLNFDLTYLINREDLISAYQFLSPQGVVIRRLEALENDSLGKLSDPFGVVSAGGVELAYSGGKWCTRAVLHCEAIIDA